MKMKPGRSYPMPIMKTISFITLGILTLGLGACYYAPPPPPPVHSGARARSPYSPGGTAVLPAERHPRSPYSPGGTVVLPREARRTMYRGQVYYRHRDVWYRPYRGGGYVIVARPY